MKKTKKYVIEYGQPIPPMFEPVWLDRKMIGIVIAVGQKKPKGNYTVWVGKP